MKKLNLNELEKIQAGGFWDGVCIAVGAVGVAGAFGLTIVTGGIGGAVLLAGEVGCFVYAVRSGFRK